MALVIEQGEQIGELLDSVYTEHTHTYVCAYETKHGHTQLYL